MAASKLKIKKIPWFIVAYDPVSTLEKGASIFGTTGNIADEAANTRIFTSNTVPDSISSQKQMSYEQLQIPGGRASIPKFGSMQAKKISFSLKLARFNNQTGVNPDVKFFEMLRYPFFRLQEIGNGFSQGSKLFKDFTPNPKVLYFWGTGAVLNYFVTNVNIDLSKFNNLGFPQVATISLDLELDEDGALFTAEMKYMQIVSGLISARTLLRGKAKPANPYTTKDQSLIFGRGGT